MGTQVSSFQRVLAYEYNVHRKTGRQVSRALSALNKNVDLPETPGLSRRGPSPNGGAGAAARPRSANKSSQNRRTQSAPVSQPTSRRNATAGRRMRNVSTGSSGGGITRKRNRKAIANTQADKRGRDSGGMTTLATSGIDGKGLKINQIR